MNIAARYVWRVPGSPGRLQLLDDSHDRLLGFRKPDELKTCPDSALSADPDVLHGPHEANADGLTDRGLDLDDESASDEPARVVVGVVRKEFESDPENRDVENTTLHPLRCGVI